VAKAPKIYQQIAENIQRIRKQRGLTQEKLALKAELNRAYTGYIERGERKPSVETLQKIAKALQVKIHELFLFD